MYSLLDIDEHFNISRPKYDRQFKDEFKGIFSSKTVWTKSKSLEYDPYGLMHNYTSPNLNVQISFNELFNLHEKYHHVRLAGRSENFNAVTSW